MTVAELIVALQVMPQDAKVLVAEESGYSTVTKLMPDSFYHVGYGNNGGWCGPYERDSTPDERSFVGVYLYAGDLPE